jgi:hypothetical protein
MGIEVLVFVLLSTNILVQNVGMQVEGITMGLIRPHFIWASEDQMAEVVACLRAGVSNLTGGPVRELDEVAWKDAPRLVSKKDAQKIHNAGRLQGIIAQRAEHTTLRAGLGTLSQTGWSGEGPRFRKFSGGKFLQRLTTVGGKSKKSRWLWGLE